MIKDFDVVFKEDKYRVYEVRAGRVQDVILARRLSARYKELLPEIINGVWQVQRLVAGEPVRVSMSELKSHGVGRMFLAKVADGIEENTGEEVSI